MNLHKGKLYWPNITKVNKLNTKFDIDDNKDILVVGIGISGAITAYRLSQRGYKVTLIEKDKIGMGSSAANTGLIQFVSDKLLTEFIEIIGEEKAVDFYNRSYDAVRTLHKIDSELTATISDTFKTTDSLILANEVNKIDRIKKEAKKESSLGYASSYLNKEVLEKDGINSYGALLCKDDINLNPYGFIYRLLNTAIDKYNLDVLEETEFLTLEDKSDYQLVNLNIYGKEKKYKFKKVIFTTGYNPPYLFRGKLQNMNINKTYVVVSDDKINYDKKADYLVREFKEKYDYFKYTMDNRLLIGGSDKDNSILKSSDIGKEDNNLIRAASNMLIENFEFNTKYSYVALFGESKDNLPYLGEDPDNPNLFLICGLGGNGTVYSVIGSEIVLDRIEGKDISKYDILRINR